MARYYVKFPQWDNETTSANIPKMEAQILATRDILRTTLDGDLLHTNWIVSDITKWFGFGGTQAAGYAFIVRHMTATVATGPEWLFILPGNYLTGISEPEEILQGPDATINQYFIETTNTTSFGYDGAICLHYNPTGATSTPYDGGWDVNGDLSGGDMTLPTTNPYTDLNTFMPNTTQPLGFSTMNFGASISQWATVWDDAKPFMALYYTWGRNAGIYTAIIMGEIIAPYLVADTYTSGNIAFTISYSDSIAGSAFTSVQLYDALGVRNSNTALYHHTNFTVDNMKTVDGEYLWDVVTLISPTEFKGYFDSDVIKVIGAFNGTHLKLFDSGGNIFLKTQQAMAFPYASGVPIFPPG